MTSMKPCGVKILGTGSAVPEAILDNEELAREHNVDPQWIEQRTGILERRICREDEGAFELQCKALKGALEDARLQGSDLSLIICASVTSEMTCPSNACRLAAEVDAKPAGAFDLVAACCGYVYAMNIADCLIRSGQYQTIAVVGCDAMSKLTDRRDRGTSILFGDAAGAAILTRDDDPTRGCFYQKMNADGEPWRALYIPTDEAHVVQDDSVTTELGKLRMHGKEVYKFAVSTFTRITEELLRETGLTPADVTQFICHQSNMRIIESAQEKLGLPDDKVYKNIRHFGNSSSGSAALCFDQLWKAEKMKYGDTIVMLAFGGGLTWSSSAWRL
ncbi:MAG: beta-ketoacyl-ACP synthase 3 [Phycisphaerales bacterium]|jgi:3-oxoacyl-[acyl-carrier-protein] synthase-3|nr:beta-ketoacyl-ACP synthase 3 [Phycisphaerales bacterium]